MFGDLIKLICASFGISKNALGEKLGYKSPSAFQRVTGGRDVRLSVLLDICNALNYKIIITNKNGFTIDLLEYYKQHKTDSDA